MTPQFSKEVSKALSLGKPLLALESTIITHGLPKPENLQLAYELENLVREEGVTPATIAVLNGVPHIGLEDFEIEALANLGQTAYKFSSFDLPVAYGMKLTGSTTVAGTSTLAYENGLRVFSTGGIGGVHPATQGPMDISHDMIALGRTPISVVSSGAKSILDLPSTFECLETLGVPIVGWKTREFPAFYFRKSGLKLQYKAESLEQLAAVAKQKRTAALLIANPIPEENELPKKLIEGLIQEGEREAKVQGVTGKSLSPFLLDYLCRKTEGRTLKANIALIKSNVCLGARLALSMGDAVPQTPSA